MSAPFRSFRPTLVVLCGACLLAVLAESGGSSPPSVRRWVDGWVEGTLAALDAEPPARERDLNRAVVRFYAGDVAEAASELAAIHRREPRWAPALRWLARAQEAVGRPEALDSAVPQAEVRAVALRGEPATLVDSAPNVEAASGQVAVPPGLHPGENLRYRVKYLFLKLASVTLATGEPIVYRGRPAHRIVFSARSNDAIPFFHIDSRFESIVDPDGAVLAHRHVASDSDTGSDEAAYDMDREAGRCTVRTVRDGLFGFEVLPLPENAQDGVSVLRLARALAPVRGSATVPTAVDARWWPTRLTTLGTERIRWQGREVQAVHMQLAGSYKGPGGLSGAVEMWISDDERAVPYRVRMKVAVGSVNLELLPDEPTTEASVREAGGA